MSSSKVILIVLLVIAALFVAVVIWGSGQKDGGSNKADEFKKEHDGTLSSLRDRFGNRFVPKVDLTQVTTTCIDGQRRSLNRPQTVTFHGACQMDFPSKNEDGFVQLLLSGGGGVVQLQFLRYGDQDDDDLKRPKDWDPKDSEYSIMVPKKGASLRLICTKPGLSAVCPIKVG